jgi:hypothetical protein
MIDPNELKMGIEIEKEHTQDEALARKIALDHLVGNSAHPGDPKYYSKLKASGLDEGCEDEITMISPAPLQSMAPSVAVISVGQTGGRQTELTSSGLGKGGNPRPLKSTGLETPVETKKVGPNKVANAKTPTLSGTPTITDSDPMNFFGGQILSKFM